jgi:hypothetical protein
MIRVGSDSSNPRLSAHGTSGRARYQAGLLTELRITLWTEDRWVWETL